MSAPQWLPAAADLLDAAGLVLEQAQRAEGDAFTYAQIAKTADDPPSWLDRAEQAREQARRLHRAVEILDWIGHRADRLHRLKRAEP